MSRLNWESSDAIGTAWLVGADDEDKVVAHINDLHTRLRDALRKIDLLEHTVRGQAAVMVERERF